MGRREKKTGKGRLDKYYKLAKEQGYRARSAFKLVQLDKKYEILKDCRCLIDLCAAPGGWLQVATKYMPPSSIIVGVDLVPIKPIPRCITFAEDITTDVCRKRLREAVKDWKADVVLHDGAPNVGTAWAQDAFAQNELVLSSLKLATEFLGQGGTFITKVFRSKDYNSLMWVFNQLFAKVEATKPPSSRNVSAEIFVVCQGYHAPKRIDPRFLNANHVFQDLDVTAPVATEDTAMTVAQHKAAGHTSMDKLTPAAMKVFHPEKKRKAREGYEDGDLTLFKRVGVMEFIKSYDPVTVLGNASQFAFESPEEKELFANEATTGDIKNSCEDLKVLGKKDFKTLLRWRSTVREEMGLDVKMKPAAEYTETAEISEMPQITEEEQMEEDLARIREEETARKRRDKRKTREKKMRDIQRMQLNMTTPMDIGLERQDGIAGDGDADFMFDLDTVENARGKGKKVRLSDDMNDAASDGESSGSDLSDRSDETDASDSDDDGVDPRYKDLEANLDNLYDEFQNQKLAKDAKARVREARKKRDFETGAANEWGGINKDKRSAAGEEGEEGLSDAEVDEESEDEGTLAHRAIDDLDDGDDEDDDSGADPEDTENQAPIGSHREADRSLIKSLETPKEPLQPSAKSRAVAMWYDQPAFKGIEGLDELMSAGLKAEATVSSDVAKSGKRKEKAVVSLEAEPTMPSSKKRKGKQSDPNTWAEEDDNEADLVAQEQDNAERIEKYGLTTAEAMTLAQQLVNREKTTHELIDDGFNRFAFDEKDGLPSWFLDDEMKHFRSNVPVTKEAVVAIRDKMRALNARPIKKVAEAKARKKMRTMKRLSNAQKKADAINETEDLTEKEKAAQIARVVSRATKNPIKKKKDEVKLIVARGNHKGLQGRPKGIKGKYKMVDPRQKKEVRAAKRIAKRDGAKRKKY